MFKNEQNISRYTRILVTNMLIMSNIYHVIGYNEKEDGMIYILIWTTTKLEPFNIIKMGQNAFEKCASNNCFLTANHNYFRNILNFDVIMFNVFNLEEAILRKDEGTLPSSRSKEQIYIMYGMEPAGIYKIPQEFNGYFNLTFTYKTTSNITLPYVIVKDENENTIGPKVSMQWMKLSEMNKTSDFVKNKLKNKRIAAAWIVSHCETPYRNRYAMYLQNELTRYGHRLDIYGKCGTKHCPKSVYGIMCSNNMTCPEYERMDECFSLIESDYYFYLSFENSFAEDYVTEKILNALEHFAVPVVFGGANYSRFMPDGIYLDANVLDPDKTAKRMNEIIKDKIKYYEFFKWHDHYSFHFSGENQYNEEVCRLCDYLNNNKNQTSIIEYIADWWNEDQPPWPTGTTSIEDDDSQNNIEKVFTNFLDFLNPYPD